MNVGVKGLEVLNSWKYILPSCIETCKLCILSLSCSMQAESVFNGALASLITTKAVDSRVEEDKFSSQRRLLIQDNKGTSSSETARLKLEQVDNSCTCLLRMRAT